MICSKCKTEKQEKYFEFRSDTKKFRTQCRTCHRGYKNLRGENKQSIVDGKKTCGLCGVNKTCDNYHVDKTTSTELTSWCKDCKKKYRLNNYERLKVGVVAVRYGISRKDAEYLLSHKECQICSSDISAPYNRAIDHCHISGIVRGVLCKNCNFGLGNFKDNTDLLRKAIKYLT